MSLGRQIAAYGLVGVLSTAISVVVIFALTHVGAHPVAANALGYVAGLANSFILNRRYTFSSQRRGSGAAFLVAFAASYGLNLSVLIACGGLAAFHPFLPQIPAILSYNVAFFLLMKHWVFANGSKQPDE